MLQMRKEDPDFRFSNSDLHRYTMGPTLSGDDLQAFEQKHQVTLSADYRLFLKEAWNGGVNHSPNHIAQNSGAGPGCGLLPLDRAMIGCDLSNPFPFTEETRTAPSNGKDDWEEGAHYSGVLEICYMNGAQFAVLVVNGPAYGTIWDLHDDFYPEEIYVPTGLTFGEWYQQWIDAINHKALLVLASERAAASAGIGVTKAQVIAICGGNWKLKEYRAQPNFMRVLQFEHLATEFELDENDVVVRLIRHSIYETGKYKI